MRILPIASATAAALIVAACQGTGTRNQQPMQVAVAPQPSQQAPVSANSALNGRWLPTDEKQRGLYTAEFRDGVFVSRAPGSNDALARGSYNTTADTVQLSYVGAVTKTKVNATCQRRTATTLYCVPTVGAPFNLARG